MPLSAQAMPGNPTSPARPEPSLWTLTLIFWTAFAGAVAALATLDPRMFGAQDPDSLMRLVQVRDLLNGQDWFDLAQHRLDPPAGTLMHWSPLMDEPLAGLTLIGNVFGNGERFALIAWPLLRLLCLMASAAQVAVHLGGRGAVAPALVLTLLFPVPTLTFLPNTIDHHNAQLALLVATLACALRLRDRPGFGFAAGALCGLMLAIGLEMLPYVALFGAFVALHWMVTGEGARGTALFGLAFGATPALLHLAAGSPAAALACDSLSWAYAVPACVAGFGLAGMATGGRSSGREFRLLALGGLAVATGGALLSVAPDCLTGPYGALSAELKTRWLDTITEAHPIPIYAAREPVGTIAVLGPPLVALVVAFRRGLRPGEASTAWLLAAGVFASAVALGFYQVRTLPYANAVAIPVLAAWLAEEARAGLASQTSLPRALPLIAAFLLAMPAVHLAFGWAAVRGLALATDGQVAPAIRPEPPAHLVEGLSAAETNCVDPASAALLAQAPSGLVLTPVFYGPSVLTLSGHEIVAAPYHRAGDAILDSIRVMQSPPDAGLPIIVARGVDYLAVCSTSRESARVVQRAPGGLLASLLAEETVPWLQPVAAARGTTLKLWRVGR